MLRSIVYSWILKYRNWPIAVFWPTQPSKTYFRILLRSILSLWSSESLSFLVSLWSRRQEVVRDVTSLFLKLSFDTQAQENAIPNTLLKPDLSSVFLNRLVSVCNWNCPRLSSPLKKESHFFSSDLNTVKAGDDDEIAFFLSTLVSFWGQNSFFPTWPTKLPKTCSLTAFSIFSRSCCRAIFNADNYKKKEKI